MMLRSLLRTAAWPRPLPARTALPMLSAPRAGYREVPDSRVYGYRRPRAYESPDYTAVELANRQANANLLRFVEAFRAFAHLKADLDPLGLEKGEAILGGRNELDLDRYGLSLDQVFDTTGILTMPDPSKSKFSLREIVEHLKETYSGRLGFEFSHIPNPSERRWFEEFVESLTRKKFSSDDKRRLHALVARSETFDHFMGKRFPQLKRYGLEGAESMMVALDTLFRSCSNTGVTEVVLCMPHRGRLNLLTDLLNFPSELLFRKIRGESEFPEEVKGANGDVISHLINSVDLKYDNTKDPVHVSMLHNPSHLEAVNPVAMGKARAKQMHLYEEVVSDPSCSIGDRVLCVQMHGDAAFTGQGIVMETLGLSNLPHFNAGGSVHIIVNNQIGYTTPAINARSTIYTSDVGKMINAPVVHVNGDHPEEVARAVQIAFEYRNKFRKDVILDLITYRRWGHNELDEPAFTQPLMYEIIRARKSVPKLYEEKLIAEKVLSGPAEIEKIRTDYFAKLDKHLEGAANYKPEPSYLQGKWSKMTFPNYSGSPVDTGVARNVLQQVGKASVTPAPDMNIHPRLDRYHMQARLKRLAEGTAIDWATAEALAFGSLLVDGYGIRISGQDVGRGTFSQRHAMLVDQKTDDVYVPLNNIANDQGKLEIANSNLSELAVLAFEYGVSIDNPNTLAIWEAQFGDFFNGAQVDIDTFISSGESKWMRQSGLVMLLPHGYDGAGPEHSSCRVERFLQLCDHPFDVNATEINPNMHVINPTTPAQYFHALRRQMKRSFRKPLIVVGPKTLLRLASCVSNLSEMEPGTHFQSVLTDSAVDASKVRKLVFLSGKAYYDMVNERAAKKRTDIAFVRVEELNPFPAAELKRELQKFSAAQEFVWLQEEPQNQGAYSFMAPRLSQLLPTGKKLDYIGRGPCATPATGISKVHEKEVAAIKAAMLA